MLKSPGLVTDGLFGAGRPTLVRVDDKVKAYAQVFRSRGQRQQTWRPSSWRPNRPRDDIGGWGPRRHRGSRETRRRKPRRSAHLDGLRGHRHANGGFVLALAVPLIFVCGGSVTGRDIYADTRSCFEFNTATGPEP